MGDGDGDGEAVVASTKPSKKRKRQNAKEKGITDPSASKVFVSGLPFTAVEASVREVRRNKQATNS